MAKSESLAPAKDASNLIDVGRKAPTFSLKDQNGNTHHLSAFAGRWVVLYFYPKDLTPGCTAQACAFRDADRQLQDAGAAVLGVSPDDPKTHAKFATKFSLDFPLLADTDTKVCQRYGVWQEKSMYGRTYMGVVRTTYLIDPAGKIAHRWDKVKVKGHAQQVIDTLRDLAG